MVVGGDEELTQLLDEAVDLGGDLQRREAWAERADSVLAEHGIVLDDLTVEERGIREREAALRRLLPVEQERSDDDESPSSPQE